MVGRRARVADAVEVQVEVGLHVVVHVVVAADAREAALHAPVPREAPGGGGKIGRDGKNAVVHDRRAPCRAIPGFKGVAGAFVGRAVEPRLRRRGERVRARRAVHAARLVAVQPLHVRGDQQLARRRRRAAEEANLVRRTVPRQLRVRQRAVVEPHALDRARQVAVRVAAAAAVSAAEGERPRARHVREVLPRHALRRRALEGRRLRAVENRRHVVAAPAADLIEIRVHDLEAHVRRSNVRHVVVIGELVARVRRAHQARPRHVDAVRPLAVEVQHLLDGVRPVERPGAAHLHVAPAAIVLLAAERVAVRRPRAPVVRIADEACVTARIAQVGPGLRRVVVDGREARVADAVEVDDEAVRHVVVERRVEAGAGGVRPLPGEAHLGGEVGEGGGENAAVQDRLAPCARRVVPGLERVARAGVGVVARRHRRGRGERVAARREHVRALRCVAGETAHARRHHHVRDRQGRAEEAHLVDRAVLLQLLVREDAVVDAHRLDDAGEPAVLALVQRAARAADAHRDRRYVALGRLLFHGAGEGRSLRDVVRRAGADGRRVVSEPGV